MVAMCRACNGSDKKGICLIGAARETGIAVPYSQMGKLKG